MRRIWKIWALALIITLGLGQPAPATISSAYTYLKIYVRQTSGLDLSTPADILNIGNQQTYTDGSGNEQADYLWHDQRNLASGATEDIDLAGSVADAFGSTLTFTAVKVLLVRNLSTTQTISVGGAAANQFVNWVANASDIVNVPPLGELFVSAPYAGFAVTAATGDILKIANSAGAAADYVIVIVGK